MINRIFCYDASSIWRCEVFFPIKNAEIRWRYALNPAKDLIPRIYPNPFQYSLMSQAIMETSKGTIHLDLFEKDAPNTVANFVKLAKSGFYDGVSFHRVIKNFMIQGGDPTGTGGGGPGYKIKCEINTQKHTPGTLSMAHAGKDTGGSQFFITHVATPHLDGVHTVFGRTTDMSVVNAIQQGDKITSVKIVD
jgi:peptidyl-prolyl cis-trans isomerase B (cyclophilin B)